MLTTINLKDDHGVTDIELSPTSILRIKRTNFTRRSGDCGAVRHGKMNKSNDNLYSPNNDQEDRFHCNDFCRCREIEMKTFHLKYACVMFMKLVYSRHHQQKKFRRQESVNRKQRFSIVLEQYLSGMDNLCDYVTIQ